MDTKIVNIQKAITPKVGKPELRFMCSACCLMVFNICIKYGTDKKIVNTQRAITPKVGKSELRFMCSARRLMVFNVCVKFHENVSSGFKVMERTRKIVNTKRAKSRRTRVTVHVFCTSSHGV